MSTQIEPPAEDTIEAIVDAIEAKPPENRTAEERRLVMWQARKRLADAEAILAELRRDPLDRAYEDDEQDVRDLIAGVE